jgi:hypothetical protein
MKGSCPSMKMSCCCTAARSSRAVTVRHSGATQAARRLWLLLRGDRGLTARGGRSARRDDVSGSGAAGPRPHWLVIKCAAQPVSYSQSSSIAMARSMC